MAEKFDPYRMWLGIPATEQPPNHYRLLGVGLFEADADVISNAADRQMVHVRTFQGGKYSALSQQVLNELSTARVCLLDPKKKADVRRPASQADGLEGGRFAAGGDTTLRGPGCGTHSDAGDGSQSGGRPAGCAAVSDLRRRRRRSSLPQTTLRSLCPSRFAPWRGPPQGKSRTSPGRSRRWSACWCCWPWWRQFIG